MGGHVEGSPFLVKAYSAARVAVTDISPGVVGRPVSFTINASHAGKVPFYNKKNNSFQ